MPKRVQMTRQRPWRKDHPNAVIVARGPGGRYGNPYQGTGKNPNRAYLVQLYRDYLARPEKAELVAAIKAELRGKDLACWCPLDEPCHADVLLKIANADS